MGSVGPCIWSGCDTNSIFVLVSTMSYMLIFWLGVYFGTQTKGDYKNIWKSIRKRLKL